MKRANDGKRFKKRYLIPGAICLGAIGGVAATMVVIDNAKVRLRATRIYGYHRLRARR